MPLRQTLLFDPQILRRNREDVYPRLWERGFAEAISFAPLDRFR